MIVTLLMVAGIGVAWYLLDHDSPIRERSDRPCPTKVERPADPDRWLSLEERARR